MLYYYMSGLSEVPYFSIGVSSNLDFEALEQRSSSPPVRILAVSP